jgi:hypothetical protein
MPKLRVECTLPHDGSTLGTAGAQSWFALLRRHPALVFWFVKYSDCDVGLTTT